MTEKRKVLGRGLESLLPRPFSNLPSIPGVGDARTGSGAGPAPDAASTPVGGDGGAVPAVVSAAPAAAPSGEAVREIPTDRVQFSRYQPRKACDQERLEELARSIEEVGLVQPIVVRPTSDGQYELIAGERRLRAAMRNGSSTIPAIVREASDLMSAEMALLENLQREDLNPMEEAAAYHRLGSGGFHLTQDEIAKRTGKDRSTVANVLRLLKLPDDVQKLIAEGDLTFGHAKVLMTLATPSLMTEVARKIVKNSLSVRQTETLVTNLVQARPAAKKERIVDPNVREAEQNLRRALGVRVTINDRNGKGRIVLEYGSLEDFDRIVEAMTGE